jgi:WD40 repeat protein
VSARDLGGHLERAAVPDAEGAERRARAVVEAAFAAAPPAAPRRPGARGRHAPLAAAVALALAAVALAVALTPPGAAVAGWVKRTLGVEAVEPQRVAFGPLPGGGRLLVTGSAGTWIVGRDGSRTRLGPYAGATWSPRGLFVGAWRGRRLSAVAPDGRVAWSYATLGDVRDVRWSPDGYRIAYRSGSRLALVAGDGRGARMLDASPRGAAPAWRPSAPHTLAWVRADGRVVVRDVDSGRTVWRSPDGHGAARELLWSADGRRLLSVQAHLVRVLDVRARRQWRVPVPHGRRLRAAAWAPRGRRLALVLGEGRGASSVVVASGARRRLAGRRIFVTPGMLDAVAWSPDGRRLLVRAPRADQWLFLPAAGRGRATAVTPVARHFGATPRIAGWCC